MLPASQELHSYCLVLAKEKYEIHTTWLKIQFSSCHMYHFCFREFTTKAYLYTNAILREKLGNRYLFWMAPRTPKH